MPQSLDQVYLHRIFSTKDRFPFFQTPDLQRELHVYMASVTNTLTCRAVKIGGVADHVHLLTRLPRTLTIADFVKETKRVSSIWLHDRGQEWEWFHWRPDTVYFPSQRQRFLRWNVTSPRRRSTIEDKRSRINTGSSLRNTEWNTMSVMSGIDL